MKRNRLAVLLVAIVALTTVTRAQVNDTRPAPTRLTLAQALQYAVDHYPTVRAVIEQVTASTANVNVAKAAYLPRLDAVWQTNRATANNVFGQLLPQAVLPSISGPVLPSASNQSVWGSAVGGLLSWEPVDFGLRSAVVREAEATVARARADEGVTRLVVQNAVGDAFLAVVSAQQALVAAAADVSRREVLARTAHTLADNQLRPGAEASRADAELAASRTRAIQARAAVTLGQTTLTRLLGIRDGEVDVDTARLLDEVPLGPSPPTVVPQHPLVQSEQSALDLARAREEILAKTDRPRVYLQSSVFARGSGARTDGVFAGGADGLSLERANWAAGAQVVFPNLFDFSALRSRRAAAGALTRAESARYDEAVLTVTSQQRAADAMVDAARAIAQNTPLQRAAALQSEAQARARYDAGLASIVEVADAQNLLAGAEYLDAAARVDVWRALLAKAVAQGTLGSLVPLLGALGGQ